MQNYILYDASEGTHNINECRYALLKLLSVYNLKPPQDLTVVVHTGEPRFFDDFITYFTNLQIRAPIGNVPHKKAQIIQNFFSCEQGNLLICDTSTYPLKPLDKLFSDIANNSVLLFRKERPNGKILKQIQSILSHSQHKMDDLPQKVEDVPIHNSAVIGLNKEMSDNIKIAGEMTNRLFDHITHPLAEKFAFSHAFQKHSPIKTANDYFADYFELNEFRRLLRTFFKKNEEESIPNLVKLAHYVDAAAIQEEKITHKRLPLLKKMWYGLTGKGWSIQKYEKKIS